MQDEPTPDTRPQPESAADSEGDRGSDAEVIGDSAALGESTALELVDEALDALDQDDLERAEELAERLQSAEPSDKS